MSEKHKRALILINKTAGMGHAQDDTLDIITKFAQNGYEPVVYPIIPGTELTSEAIIEKYRDGVDVILCSGGDGTLNHVMSSVMEFDTEKKPVLAYLPTGSTNDFARGLNIPEVRELAITRAINGTSFAYDIGKMDDRYFNYVAAFGAFSEISYATDQDLKNVFGYAAYVISAIMKLPQNIGYSCHMEIEADGIKEEGEYLFGAVCNSVSVGGVKLFGNMDVKYDDGKMELLLIHAPKNFGELNGILSSLATGGTDNPNITFSQISRAEFHSDEDVSWTLDGEYGGDKRDTVIEIRQQAMVIRV